MLDLRPDRRRPVLADVAARQQFYSGAITTTHTTLAVNETITAFTDELQRFRGVQVGAVAGGTVTVQVQAEGRDLFDDTTRPVSGGEVQRPTEPYLIPAGTPITTIIEATSGVPTGTAGVVIETEPFVVHPRPAWVELRGKDRMFASRRRQAEAANRGESLLPRNWLGRMGRLDRASPELASPVTAGQSAKRLLHRTPADLGGRPPHPSAGGGKSDWPPSAP